jgi:hypothetical protein
MTVAKLSSNGPMTVANDSDTIMTGNISPLDVFMPSCMVLVGNYVSELDSAEKRRSFELYRSSLNGVSRSSPMTSYSPD